MRYTVQFQSWLKGDVDVKWFKTLDKAASFAREMNKDTNHTHWVKTSSGAYYDQFGRYLEKHPMIVEETLS